MRQAAALPFRYLEADDTATEVLLVTSSGGRWIIPKGDIDGGMEPHLAAEKEAFEEGGVRGRIDRRPIGRFGICKEQDGAAIPVEVDVFPLEVSEELKRWPEMDFRKRRWLPTNEAADAVEDGELASILRSFRP